MNIPNERKYTKEHEWVKLEEDLAHIGITDHAQHELGDIVFVELPRVGTQLAAGAQLAVVESVKAVSEVYCPVSGEVIKVNAALENSPQLLNEAPYANPIATIQVSGSEYGTLLDAAQYEAFLQEG